MIKISKLLQYDPKYFINVPDNITLLFPDINNEVPFYIKRNFISPQECDQIVSYLRENQPSEEVIHQGTEDKADLFRSVFRYRINKEFSWLYMKEFKKI